MTHIPEIDEALASEHQRQAKLVIMQAIAEATDRGLRKGWELRGRADVGMLEGLWDGEGRPWRLIEDVPYPGE